MTPLDEEGMLSRSAHSLQARRAHKLSVPVCATSDCTRMPPANPFTCLHMPAQCALGASLRVGHPALRHCTGGRRGTGPQEHVQGRVAVLLGDYAVLRHDRHHRVLVIRQPGVGALTSLALALCLIVLTSCSGDARRRLQPSTLSASCGRRQHLRSIACESHQLAVGCHGRVILPVKSGARARSVAHMRPVPEHCR